MTPSTATRPPLRILTAVSLCDGHDSAIMTINAELTQAGMEVVYLGYHQSVPAIARAAVQEDVRAVGISSYNGGHVEFFAAIRQALDARSGDEIGLFGGGGGTITREDAAMMQQQGTDRIFFAGEPLAEIVRWTEERYRPAPWPPPDPGTTRGRDEGRRGDAATRRGGDAAAERWRDEDRDLAQEITLLEARQALPNAPPPPSPPHPFTPSPPHLLTPTSPRVVGVTGPGGAGKSTLIDELVRRCLERWPEERVAVLSNDPSAEGPGGEGALLGDRATMIYCQDDRVFVRSLATRGSLTGIAAAVPEAVPLLRARAFGWIFVETVGTGQESVPFPAGTVDVTLLVMTPEYGGRLQLHKIAMLRRAELVVLNKADRPAALTARAELEARVQELGRSTPVLPAVAKRHRDAGVDAIFEALSNGSQDGQDGTG